MAYQQLLLFQDVDGLGRKGQVVRARPGFARNYLLPQGLATMATPHALRRQKKLQDERDAQAQVDRAESEAIALKLSELALLTKVKVDQEGHMYGSVSIQEIIDLLTKEADIVLDKKQVHLKSSLKSTGIHQISVKLKEGISAQFSLTIEPEEMLKDKKEKVEKSPAL